MSRLWHVAGKLDVWLATHPAGLAIGAALFAAGLAAAILIRRNES